MPEAPVLQQFLDHIRTGHAPAVELLRRFEIIIRATVRARLTDPALRREFDSVDVCQSVLASFFIRAAAGVYEIDRPEMLIGLLTKMADRKLAHRIRDAHRQRRDVTRQNDGVDIEELPCPQPGPAEIVLNQDLFATVLLRLSDEERELVRRRQAGHSWMEIAGDVGGTSVARRVQLRRALDRVAVEVGLDAEDDDDE